MKISAVSFPLAAFALLVSNAVRADELPPILVQDDVVINPQIDQPGAYSSSKGVPADGGDFLRQINGVNTSRFGGRGLEPIIRGQSQTRLNILLDGAYVHGGCPNRMDPPASWAALETYEKVEVIRGVQTLIHGGGGSGGTVLFERDTRSLAQEKGVHGRASIAGSSNATKGDLLADVVAAGESAYLRVFTQLKEYDNYKDGDGREVKSAFDHRQGGVVLGYTPSDQRFFELTLERNKFSDALYPGAGMDSPEEDGSFYKFRYHDDAPALAWLDKLQFEAYKSDVDHLMDNYSLRTPPTMMGRPMLSAVPTTSDTTGGRLVLESNSASTRWRYGIDVQENQRNATLSNAATTPFSPLIYLWPDATIRQIGLFSEATTRLDEKQRLTYGLRLDQVDSSADSANRQPNAASPYRANVAYRSYYGENAEDQQETNIGGLLRYERDLAPGLTVFSGLSRTVRTADATERYMNRWNMSNPMLRWVGNPTLEPEKHHQLDLGLKKRGTGYEIDASMFYDAATDYILRDVARGQSGVLLADGAEIYRNVDARLWGVELEGSWQASEHLELSAAVSMVEATNTTDDRPIAQTPPLGGKLQLDYRADSWDVGGRVRFADKQDRIDTLSRQEVGETPAWAVLDLYASYDINSIFSLRAGMDNVLDKTYAEHASRSNLLDSDAIKVNEPGRSFWLKLSAAF